MNLSEAIKNYQSLKQTKKKIELLFDEKLRPVKYAMSRLELEMLDFLIKSGQDGAKTDVGTISKSISKNVTVDDANLLYEFIKKHDAVDLLQRKINKSTYEEYIVDGLEVPGVTVNSRISLNIRKK